MSDGLSLSLQDIPPLQDHKEYIPPDTPGINLTTFASWIEIQDVATLVGMLDLIASDLYRRGLFFSGNEVKHLVSELRA